MEFSETVAVKNVVCQMQLKKGELFNFPPFLHTLGFRIDEVGTAHQVNAMEKVPRAMISPIKG
jgi:hypothetical protein